MKVDEAIAAVTVSNDDGTDWLRVCGSRRHKVVRPCKQAEINVASPSRHLNKDSADGRPNVESPETL